MEAVPEEGNYKLVLNDYIGREFFDFSEDEVLVWRGESGLETADAHVTVTHSRHLDNGGQWLQMTTGQMTTHGQVTTGQMTTSQVTTHGQVVRR